jgi:catechol 2,3-dioxygenase-like lactoylglutathione lyase family enzyme
MLVESMCQSGCRRHAVRMNLHRIDHVSLDVRDRLNSIAWYEEILGLRAAGTSGPVDQPVFLGPPGARLGLFQERPPGLRHIALATDGVGQRGVLDRLERLAIPYRREHHRDHDSLYFADPDGSTLEIMVPTT